MNLIETQWMRKEGKFVSNERNSLDGDGATKPAWQLLDSIPEMAIKYVLMPEWGVNRGQWQKGDKTFLADMK